MLGELQAGVLLDPAIRARQRRQSIADGRRADDEPTDHAEMLRREPLPKARSEEVVAGLMRRYVEQSTVIDESQAEGRVRNPRRIDASKFEGTMRVDTGRRDRALDVRGCR